MKKFFIIVFIAAFCIEMATAETNISVTQSIRYGNGPFAPMDSPQFSISKALDAGGKLHLRYDFEITNKGFLEPDFLYIFLKLPGDYVLIQHEDYFKVTALHGADDLSLRVTELFKHLDYYSELRKTVGRNPRVKNWYISHEIADKKSTTTTFLESFTVSGFL